MAWKLHGDRMKVASLEWQEGAGSIYAFRPFPCEDRVRYAGIRKNVLRSRLDGHREPCESSGRVTRLLHKAGAAHGSTPHNTHRPLSREKCPVVDRRPAAESRILAQKERGAAMDDLTVVARHGRRTVASMLLVLVGWASPNFAAAAGINEWQMITGAHGCPNQATVAGALTCYSAFVDRGFPCVLVPAAVSSQRATVIRRVRAPLRTTSAKAIRAVRHRAASFRRSSTMKRLEFG
jgi:hypothetical protein